MTRLKTSRPDWSVPNQCTASGGCNALSISTRNGSNGAIHGRGDGIQDQDQHQARADEAAEAAACRDAAPDHAATAAIRGLSHTLVMSATRLARVNTNVNTMTTPCTNAKSRC